MFNRKYIFMVGFPLPCSFLAGIQHVFMILYLLVQDFLLRSSNSCKGIVINLRPRRLLFVNVLDLVYRIAAIKRSWYSRLTLRNRF